MGPSGEAAGSDAGTGSILAVAIIATTMCLTGLMVPVAMASAVRQSTNMAADAAALAAADAASGAAPGFPCERAGQAAQLNGAALEGCEVNGLIATVSVSSLFLGFTVLGRARAGPPP